MALREIRPRGVLATSLREMQMFRIPLEIMIVTDQVRLGGVYSPRLIGVTPRNLALAGQPGNQMTHGWPATRAQLPAGTRHNGQYGQFLSSMNGLNWLRP